ncbi:hypothetical protein Fmac_005045 [Flemingia macrophylla]|uniref:Guanine nucleotide-binding protein-like 3 N-terminal domain-containing protein n=1 Tax=Flemingia macrophylla TaxID=520843 RepID=A0ABD1N9A2_9FABA
MVKKSMKTKTKRISLKKKYMVIKKVKEHNRKKAKKVKKFRLSGKKKVEKDPGIPNDWPLKEHEVKAPEAGRVEVIEELKRKKVECKERVIEVSDVLLEVVDARDPLDLVLQESVEKWLKYLIEELLTVAFKCNT